MLKKTLALALAMAMFANVALPLQPAFADQREEYAKQVDKEVAERARVNQLIQEQKAREDAERRQREANQNKKSSGSSSSGAAAVIFGGGLLILLCAATKCLEKK